MPGFSASFLIRAAGLAAAVGLGVYAVTPTILSAEEATGRGAGCVIVGASCFPISTCSTFANNVCGAAAPGGNTLCCERAVTQLCPAACNGETQRCGPTSGCT